MKNKLVLLGVIILIPFITACGSDNKLKCTESFESDVLSRDYTYEFDDNNILTSVLVEEKINFGKVNDITELECGNSIEECMAEARELYDECLEDSYYENCKIVDESKTGLTIQSNLSKKGIEAIKEDWSVDKLTKEVIEKNSKNSNLTCQ